MTPAAKQEFSNVKIWAETYALLLELQRRLPAHPNKVDIVHEALCLYTKVNFEDMELPASPKLLRTQD